MAGRRFNDRMPYLPERYRLRSWLSNKGGMPSRETVAMPPVLALYEDVVSSAATLALPALPRMIFVVHGTVTIADRLLLDGDTWHGEGAVTLIAGEAGLTALALRVGRQVRPGGGGGGGGPAQKPRPPPRHPAAGRAPAARRQRRLSARRLRLPAPPPGAGHPLPDRGRHPHRYPRP